MILKLICFGVKYLDLTEELIFMVRHRMSCGLEFKKSLKVFLDVCKEKGIEPYKEYSGKFNLRVSPELHAEIASRASAEGKSLNQWIVETIDQIVHTY